MGLKADYRWYVSLEAVKRELEIMDTEHDDLLKAFIEQASDSFERLTQRRFIPITATCSYDWQQARSLSLHDDLLSVTALSDESGPITDYVLYGPHSNPNKPPFHRIELKPTSNFGYSLARQQAITITGEWGYCNDYAPVGATVVDDPLSDSTQTLTVVSGKLETGWSLLIGSEQIFVASVTGGEPNDTATVYRAQGGTAASAHAAGTGIYRYVPPPMVTRAVTDWVKLLYQTRSSDGVKMERIGDYAIEYAGEWMPKNTAAKVEFFKRRRL
jgi:hypothetical protein